MALVEKKIKQDEVEIPTASMSDIAFLLIIFFMTTSVFSRDKGLKLVLPEKGQEVKVASENLIKIAINPQGEVFFGDEPVTVSQIPEKVKAKLAENPKYVVLIRTNELAPYEKMIEVLDAVKSVPEAKRISLSVIKTEQAQGG